MQDTVLILDEDPVVRQRLTHALREWGYDTIEVGTAEEVIAVFDRRQPGTVLLDLNLSCGSAINVLCQIKRRQPSTIVLVACASGEFAEIVTAMRSGATDFIGKPIKLDELEIRIRNATRPRASGLEPEPARPRATKSGFEQIIGRSPVLLETLRLARKVAQSEVSSVLLQGESGTGKELVAKAIHHSSPRAAQPFIAINCAALPPNLIESELFGHEKGAFTDARVRKEGLFEQANGGGTIFLDEISELDINLQAKLLRVLEEGSFRRVGGLKDVPFNARVIAASNRNLKRESEAGRFRLDLYYRLAVIEINIPRLCDRGDDVLLLAEYFKDSSLSVRAHDFTGFTPETLRALRRYHWPGNVRELKNVIQRAMILEEGYMISMRHLPREIVPNMEEDHGSESTEVIDADASVTLPRDGISLGQLETSLLKQALSRAGGNQTRAADLLGLTRDQFRYRLKKLREASANVTAAAAAAGAH